MALLLLIVLIGGASWASTWSPYGRYVVFTCQSKLYDLDFGNRNNQSQLADRSDYYRAVWSPLVEKIAVKINDGDANFDNDRWRFLDLEIGRGGFDLKVATTIKKAGWGEIKKKMKGGI